MLAITPEDILRLSTPKKLGILGGIIILIIVLFALFLIKPEYEKLTRKEKEYNKLKLDLDAKKKVARDHKKFQAKLESLKRELEIMKAKLPDKKEIPSLLKTISSLGKESGLTFKLFRPKPEIAKDFYSEIPVEIQVEGGYHDVATFFYKVGMLDRIVNISNVSMGKPREKKGKMELTTSCLATTFRFVEKPTTAEEEKGKKAKKKARKKKKKKKK
ncbi:MAG: pilus assembly protein PilO [Deltaproteobacteria bacterium]|nr:MAG: pilus assembly protein PilO [Deltaproteobacteria bacterium]